MPVIFPLCEPIGRAIWGRSFIGTLVFVGSVFKVGVGIVTLVTGGGARVGCLLVDLGCRVVRGAGVVGGGLCRSCIACFQACMS